MRSTVGAPHRWVTPQRSINRYASAGSNRRRHTWVAPTAVTAQGKHHPLQWNMGRVHRYTLAVESPVSMISPIAFRAAPRWEYTTPLGLPVVPEV